MIITDIQFQVTSFRFEQPMKVAFATIVDMDSCIVKILTDEGIVGYGEAAPLPFVTGDNMGTILAVGKEMREALIGMDPRAIGAIHRVMDKLYAGNGAVKAGIDIACYDIASKAAGVPLYKYLGGDDPLIHSDVTIGIDTPHRHTREDGRQSAGVDQQRVGHSQGQIGGGYPDRRGAHVCDP